MKYATFKAIIEHVKRVKASNVDGIQEKFPTVPLDSLRSIVSQEYTRMIKKTHYRHHMPARMQFYYDSYVAMSKKPFQHGCVILELAKEHDLSPSMMARIILEQHYAAMNQPISKQHLSRLLRDSCQIEDSQLSCDVHLAVINDDNNGPFAEAVKRSFGNEYEDKLKKHLHDVKVPFLDEVQLRNQGYDKTPDVKLEMPIAVNGSVINWIESKASFGDPENHKNYLKDQLWSYWNRFGPGLVIYWFGFVDELDEHSQKGILMRDSFPSQEEIQMMDPDSITDSLTLLRKPSADVVHF